MGIPFNNLVCASNENNVLTEFFHTGSYNMATRRLQQTISPSIDILKSSNLERLIYHASGSGTVVANLMRSLEENKVFKVSAGLVWEPLVFPPNDVRGASEEIPYWWRVTTHIWVVLSDWSCREGNLLQPIRSTAHIWIVTRQEFLYWILRRYLQGNQLWLCEVSAVFWG